MLIALFDRNPNSIQNNAKTCMITFAMRKEEAQLRG